VLTHAVGDLKRAYPDYLIDIRSPCPEIWENNPHLTKLKDNDPEVEKIDVQYELIHESGWRGLHFEEAFRIDLEQKLGVSIKTTGILPEIYLSEDEKHWINHVEVAFGWKGPFWLLNAGCKPDNELKQYHRWVEVAQLFNDYFKGRVKLIQIGHKDHNHESIEGALSLVGQTDLRQLIRLMYWADGVMTPISFPFVLAAAFDKPGVIVAGGKEGIRWQTYETSRYLTTIGQTECSRYSGCWRGGTYGKCIEQVDFKGKKVPKCFNLIEPYMIVDEVIKYYLGGRLKYDARLIDRKGKDWDTK